MIDTEKIIEARAKVIDRALNYRMAVAELSTVRFTELMDRVEEFAQVVVDESKSSIEQPVAPQVDVVVAIQGYLRRCKIGGMPSNLAKKIEDAVVSAQRLGYFDPVGPKESQDAD